VYLVKGCSKVVFVRKYQLGLGHLKAAGGRRKKASETEHLYSSNWAISDKQLTD